MIYGEEKVRQMVRSILPSTRAKAAREDKAKLNRKLRRTTRHALKQIRSEEDWLEDNTDLWDDGQTERYMIVGMRRGADKISHFQKWAEHKAADIPDGEKMDYIKSIIKGRGVIIEHAFTHLEWLDGFDKDLHRYSSRWRYRHKAKPELSEDKIRATIQRILEDSWAHKKLNNIIKRNLVTVEWYKYKEYINHYDGNGEPVKKEGFRVVYKRGVPTLLLGVHNVDDFLSFIRNGSSYYIKGDGVHYQKKWNNKYTQDLLPNPRHQPHLQTLVKLFIEAYMDTDGDRASLMDLEKKFERRSFDKRRYYNSYSNSLEYSWTWE